MKMLLSSKYVLYNVKNLRYLSHSQYNFTTNLECEVRWQRQNRLFVCKFNEDITESTFDVTSFERNGTLHL